MDLDQLNQKAIEMINRYSSLEIGRKEVVCPYFTNHAGLEFMKLLRKAEIEKEQRQKVRDLVNERKLNYGWFKGKGAPEEIEIATKELAKKTGTDLSKVSAEVVRNFMQVMGLGVDCSGFVYQVLLSAFSSSNLKDEFKDSLNWSDETKKRPSRAGTSIFTSPATESIEFDEIRELDLILNMQEQSEHVGILIKIESQMYLAHSTISREEAGVVIETVNLESRDSFFDELIDAGGNLQRFINAGHFEFRRLSILQ